VSIDPYQLAIDSTAVSFDALARLVDAELEARGITGAVIVGHSHGGGVALRLAANAPQRVAALYLLDVGAVPSNRGNVFGSAIKLVPIIARIPTGKAFIRHRIMEGLRENSAKRDWIDDGTRRAYTEPFLDNVDRVIAMARRLSNADEPELVESVLRRVSAPITVLVGGQSTKAGPGDIELRLVERIAARSRVETMPGVGHFPHEEAPDEVARLVARPITLTTHVP
jgi:pimeloyl-ACP methyl ester carboxylesterase